MTNATTRLMPCKVVAVSEYDTGLANYLFEAGRLRVHELPNFLFAILWDIRTPPTATATAKTRSTCQSGGVVDYHPSNIFAVCALVSPHFLHIFRVSSPAHSEQLEQLHQQRKPGAHINQPELSITIPYVLPRSALLSSHTSCTSWASASGLPALSSGTSSTYSQEAPSPCRSI